MIFTNQTSSGSWDSCFQNDQLIREMLLCWGALTLAKNKVREYSHQMPSLSRFATDMHRSENRRPGKTYRISSTVCHLLSSTRTPSNPCLWTPLPISKFTKICPWLISNAIKSTANDPGLKRIRPFDCTVFTENRKVKCSYNRKAGTIRYASALRNVIGFKLIEFFCTWSSLDPVCGFGTPSVYRKKCLPISQLPSVHD